MLSARLLVIALAGPADVTAAPSRAAVSPAASAVVACIATGPAAATVIAIVGAVLFAATVAASAAALRKIGSMSPVIWRFGVVADSVRGEEGRPPRFWG